MSPASTKNAERILFVRLSHLGDVIHALPVWHAVASAYPGARLAFATQPAYAPLLSGLPRLERIIPFDRGGGLGAWWRYRRAVRAFKPTWTIDCQGNWKGAVATRLSGAPRRSGMQASDWREPSARRLLNDLAPSSARPAHEDHAVDRQLALAQHVSGAPAAADFDLALTQAELQSGRATLAAHAPHANDTTPALMHLGRTGDPRSWPATKFFELAKLVADQGRPVVLVGGPDETDLMRAAQQAALHPLIHLELNTLALRPLAALFAAAAQANAQLVACDSGPTHLAAAVGLRVHLLAGPQDPSRTGPWPPPGRNDSSISSGPHTTQTAPIDLACRPCLLRTCRNKSGAECLETLSAAQVFRSLDRGAPLLVAE